MSDAYTLWKTAHVVSATVVFGTGLGIAYFTWFGYRRAMRAGDLGALRTILRLTVIADASLTAPAVAFQLASGLVLMRLLGWPWVSPWSIAVLGLVALAGACWLPVLAMQVRLHRTAARAPRSPRCRPPSTAGSAPGSCSASRRSPRRLRSSI